MSSDPNTAQTASKSMPWPQPTEHSETYKAHCHCGAVRYAVTLSPPLHPAPGTTDRWKAIQCDCSGCSRNGFLLVHPYKRNVQWLQGQDVLTTYRFGSKTRPQWFCSECGSSLGIDISTMGDLDGGERYAINVRMFEDVDIDTLEIKRVQGSKMEPQYSID